MMFQTISQQHFSHFSLPEKEAGVLNFPYNQSPDKDFLLFSLKALYV